MQHSELIRILHKNIPMNGKHQLVRDIKTFTAFIGPTFLGKKYDITFEDDRILIALPENADKFIKFMTKYTTVMFLYEIIDADIPQYQLN